MKDEWVVVFAAAEVMATPEPDAAKRPPPPDDDEFDEVVEVTKLGSLQLKTIRFFMSLSPSFSSTIMTESQ